MENRRMQVGLWVGTWNVAEQLVRRGGRRRTRRQFGALGANRGGCETLEVRTLLSSVAISPKVTPEWFAAGLSPSGVWIADGPVPPTREWVVQLTPAAAAAAGGVEGIRGALPGGGPEYSVVRGLGGVGQFLLRAVGGQRREIEGWLESSAAVQSFSIDGAISLNGTGIANDPAFNQLWGLENSGSSGGKVDADIDASTAWQKTTGSSSVVVAVVDTGIDLTHPDLMHNLWVNPGEIAGDGKDNDGNGFVDDVNGWDFSNNDANPMDDNQHGTHVAGTIGAVGNNGIGVVGVNWDVSLMALKFLNSSGNGSDSGAISAINYATMMKERGTNVRAINASWGDGGYTSGLYSAIDSAGQQGILFVAAAGNSGVNADSAPFYPAAFNLGNIISVAATTRTDALAGFSNYGATSVDLGAPGESIYSTLPNNRYGNLSGTSMAAPHVSGVVALAAERFPDATAGEIRAAILGGVDQIASLSGKTVTGGRLNAAGTLNLLETQQTTTPSTYLAGATAYSAVNLQPGSAGVATVVDNSDDDAKAFDLGTNTFRFYGQTYSGNSSLYVNPNGLITFGGTGWNSLNSNFANDPTWPTIAPYWDDLRTDLGSNDRVLAKYEDDNSDGRPERLILEWNEVSHYLVAGSSATFQAVLELNTGGRDGRIQFNYIDVDFGSAGYNNGASATIGVSPGVNSSIDHTLISKDSGANPWVGNSRSLVLDRDRPTATIAAVGSGSAGTGPVSAAVDSLTVTFSKAIKPESLTREAVTLTRDGAVVPLDAGVQVTALGGNTYRISNLAPFTGVNGSYVASLNLADVRDVQGHPGLGLTNQSWTMSGAVPNIALRSATANGFTQLSFEYEIEYNAVPAFDVGVYLSRDGDANHLNDTLLGTVPLSSSAERSIGRRTKTVEIGAGVGQIPLPGAGGTEFDDDYRLILVADPQGLLAEQEPASGSDNLTVFSGAYHAKNAPILVQGTAGADTVVVDQTSRLTFNGQSYSYPAGEVTTLRFRLQAGNDSLDATAATKVVLAFGGGGDDVLRSGVTNDTLSGGDGSDSLQPGAGFDVLIGGAGDDSLVGGDGNDTYLFNADVALGTDVLSDVSGADLLDFSPTTSSAVSINLGLTTNQSVNSNLTLRLSAADAFENVIGGGGNDTLVGNAQGNQLTGGAGNDSLQGGVGSDTYNFRLDSNLGRDQIVETSSSGTDTIDFSQSTVEGASLDLGLAGVQTVSSFLRLELVNAGQIEAVNGTRFNDLLAGDNWANRLTGLGGDDTLVGRGGEDTYVFDADGDIGSDTVIEDPDGGADTLDYSFTTNFPVTVDLAAVSIQNVNTFQKLLLRSGNVETVIGGSKNDRLLGDSQGNTLVGGPGDDVLIGRGGDDIYSYTLSTPLGSDQIEESADEGIDTLDFSRSTAGGVGARVNLGASGLQAVHSNLNLTLKGGDVIENISGSFGDDDLTGNSLVNVLIGGPGNDILTGGPGNDTYVFRAETSGTDTLREDPDQGFDLLDLSPVTSTLTLDLGSTALQTVYSRLSLTLSSGTAFEAIIGSNTNDVLRGNSLANVLIGGGGADQLLGLGGRDLLVGGSGADTLDGGVGEDLVLSGLVSFFNESTKSFDRVAMSILTTEGNRTDLAYAGRVANLRAGVGPGGAYRLSSVTVLTDGSARDSLTGGLDLDWFWSFNDTVTDLATGESIN